MARNIERMESNIELVLLRALFATMAEGMVSMIESNRNDVRDIFIIRTPSIRINENDYLIVAIKSDTSRRTSIPYLDLLDANNVAANVKEFVLSLARSERALKEDVVSSSAEEQKKFKSKFRYMYNSLISETDGDLDREVPSFAVSADVLTIIADIFKNTINDLEEALKELTSDEANDFMYSCVDLNLQYTRVRKERRDFIFDNGIILTVYGFQEIDRMYDSIAVSLDYKIKREAKNDGLF